MLNCFWLPDLLLYDSIYPNISMYDNAVHRIFENDFLNTQPMFLGRPVYIRKNPPVNGREQTYYHITSKDYDYAIDRQIDIMRCERIRWVKAFIENHNCNIEICRDCSGMKVWCTLHERNQTRYKILLEEERYVVILEERTTYFLLVTAYYVEYDHALRKLIKEYKKAKSASEETQSGTPSTLR